MVRGNRGGLQGVNMALAWFKKAHSLTRSQPQRGKLSVHKQHFTGKNRASAAGRILVAFLLVEYPLQ